AFMEQQHAKAVPKMNHNTRIWCSFDSPHHGANVPIGNMVGLVQLAERANSEGAANKFRIKLSNPAAKEQLVTQTALNSGESIFQNNTAPLRQIFLNNINSNGLTGSGGWPMNLKRIALSNGSDKGIENGIPDDEIIHIKANKLAKKVFEFQIKFNGRHNNSVDIADIFFTNWWLIFLVPHNPDPVSLLNSNPNGALEIVPGSILDSNQDVFDGIIEELKKEKTNIKTQSCKPNHTFMPVISTLAFNNTNVDWSQVLNNRNLVCTGEIPFDAYFIDGRNNPHITITEPNYNWLEYQFLNGVSGCDPVCGTFTITGDQQICDGNTNTVNTYTFNGGIDAGETLTWSVSGDLIINSSSGNTVGIKITTANGSGIVISTLTNACGDRVIQNFQVQVGKPNIYLSSILDEIECRFLVTINTTPVGKTPLSYQWSNDGINYTNGSQSKEFWIPPHHTSKWVYARADWGCGFTADDILLEFPEDSNCDNIWPLPPLSNSANNASGKFLLTPNPTLSGWNLTIPQEFKENTYISLFDMNNQPMFKNKVENSSNNIFIEGEHLTPGVYFINISNQKDNFTIKAMKL
ncbi:MAG: T9SS type A sorting domain-containing protein, partial [Saprospiraceae bacterium]|nr:T9SS type A sorting domain-containing protein [Saprospiraceae bacterium]